MIYMASIRYKLFGVPKTSYEFTDREVKLGAESITINLERSVEGVGGIGIIFGNYRTKLLLESQSGDRSMLVSEGHTGIFGFGEQDNKIRQAISRLEKDTRRYFSSLRVNFKNCESQLSLPQ